MKYLTYTGGLAALVLTLTACESALEVDPTSASPPGAAVHAVNHSIMGNPAALKDGRSTEELNGIIRRNLDASFAEDPETGMGYRWLFRSERPLAEKDAAAARLIDAHPGIEWVHLRQMVAAELLELHKRNASDDIDAIERYTAVLVEAENPSADLFTYSLPLLEERWSASERQEAARVAVRSATDWLGQNCTDCAASARRAAAPGGDTPAANDKRRAVEDALGTLADLARG
ncbi:hypothetical protein [Rubrivirga sp.]|uniref:hypothetical protein n=1 Tax=Rubrivirga sp. TaxID=1885344 RepID=UPI003C772C4D